MTTAVAPPTPPVAPSQRQRRLGLRLTLVGVVLTLLGLASIGVLIALTIQASAAFEGAMADTYTRSQLFGLYQSERSTGALITAVPAIFFLLAMCLAGLGELLRRGIWTRAHRGFWQGGSNTATVRMLSPAVHLVWIAAPLLVWAALIAVPLVLSSAGGWPANLHYSVVDDVWFLLGMYGGVASGIAAIMGVSLVKKLAWTRRVRAGTTLPAGTGSRFWRGLTYYWRFDLWLAFIGGAILGPCWMALFFEDPPFFFAALGIGVLFIGLAVLAAVNFWRSAENLAAGESVS
ncbi:hypothetical protein D6T64_10470 [Cryobacterium melibiosiphilum]|uniref:Uncharacterized protein n=1 Tax=Cryobacterium melibiosiphilum TaxID=995039 RepID=A0A3A5MGJ1_9MICO|nr:hypothetical protein [Cryobacterium melibiosiphilum]RJT88542.1 hypothetical protein D6T64_10470 [Cryobacterium melibiosiphilum]